MAFVLEESLEETPQYDFSEIKETSNIPRNIARSMARGLETALGSPSDLLSLILRGGTKAGEAIGLGDKESLEKEQKIQKYLPTSSFLREKVTKPLTGKYLEPQSSGEEMSDEIISDAVGLLLPIKGTKGFKTGKRILQAIGTSGSSNYLSDFAGKLGVSEKGKTAIKLGSMIILSSLNPGGAKKHVSSLYKEAEQAIKGNPLVNAKSLKSNLRGLKMDLKQGLEAPTEKAVISKIDALDKKIKGGRVSVNELWSSKRSINEEMAKSLFESPTKATRARAKNLFKKINKDINKELSLYGKENPKFGKAFRSAEEGFGILSQSELIGNFIKRNAKYSPVSAVLYPLIHAAPTATIGGAAAGGALYKSGQLGYRIAKSPTLAKYYGEVVKSAAQQNAVAMNRSLKKLDEELQKTEKEKEKKDSRFILED